jgi:S1-C subfamily serine protease
MVTRTIAAFGLVVVLLISQVAFGIDPEANAVFRVRTPAMADGSYGQGTCFAIKQTDTTLYLGTAFHVVETTKGNITTGYAYQLESDTLKDLPKAKVVAVDIKADIAVLACQLERKFDILPLVSVENMKDVRKIGFAYGPSGREVKFHGYASGFWLETSGILSFAYENYVYSDGVVAPGQSGGPATTDGVIIGVVSGGSSWYDAVEDKEKPVTWPARLGSARRLQEILDWAVKQNDVSKPTTK